MSSWRPFSSPAAVRAPLIELVAEALANLYAERQRSALALLGILIGAASIVAMLTIGHMAQLETLKLFKHMGVDMLQIHAMPVASAPGVLDPRALEALPRTDPAVQAQTPLAVDQAKVLDRGQTADVGLAGVTANLPDLVRLTLKAGRFITAADDGGFAAVVGGDAAAKLSAPGAPLALGDQIRIRGYVYTVVGVVGPLPNTVLDPIDFNNVIEVPLNGSERIMSLAGPVTAMLRLRPGSDVKAAGARIAKTLADPAYSLQVLSAQEVIGTLNAQKAIHARLLTAIGAISLLVGGIGVMNVMLMGVMERRSEIGLRAAIGASPQDLQIMFLVEAATLAFAGGVLGLLAGLLAALVTAMASHWTFSLPLYVLPLGPGLAALVGVSFGFYPALKASRLDPIEALRAE